MLPHFLSSAFVSDLDPLIITAPTIRSGTTLVQRLLCSSCTALIYGEKCAADLELFVNLYTFKVQEYGVHKGRLAQELNQVVQGRTDDWIWDLLPDVNGYLAALAASVFAGIAYCRDYAGKLGRPVWGFKYPGWKPAFIRLLRAAMPRARFIVIHRDVTACYKSAKAWRAFNSLEEVQEFCRTWKEGMEYWHGVRHDPAVLMLDYEDLAVAPQTVFQRLAEFTGVHDIKPEVLQRKINTWMGTNSFLEAQNGHAPPAELTEVERQIVREASKIYAEQTEAALNQVGR